MSGRLPRRFRLPRLTVVIAAATGLLLSAIPVDAAWTRFHGDGDNTGFVDIVTAPAGKGSRSVPGLGTFAPGAGPVIAPDGTVYLGTEQGKLIALHADGSPAWTRELARVFGTTLAIVASPAVGADGSIYVIGRLKVRDHTTGGTVLRYISELHKFTPSGGFLWHTRLPLGELNRGGDASAPPNIWQASGTEVVMVPAAYSFGVTRLFAFSTEGVLLAETVVSRFDPGPFVGGFDFCQYSFLGFACFSLPDVPPPPADPADRLPKIVVRPAPGPAVVQVSAGAPLVVVADQFHDVAGFSFSPTAGFFERFRAHEPASFMRSSPTPLFGHSTVGTTTKIDLDEQQEIAGAIFFAGPSASKLTSVRGLSPILATPTRLEDVRFVVVESRADGSAILVLKRVLVPDRVRILSRTSLPGQSIAAPAASRTHVFVSTAGRLPLLRRRNNDRGRPPELVRRWAVAARDRTGRPCLCYCLQHPLHFPAARGLWS